MVGISILLYFNRCALAVNSRLNVNPLSDSILTLSNNFLENNRNEFVESFMGKFVK